MTKTVLKQSWKIGELANDTGLTVRTLHYYDELELLKPSHGRALSWTKICKE